MKKAPAKWLTLWNQLQKLKNFLEI